MKKKIYFLILWLSIFFITVTCIVYFFIFTSEGSILITRFVLSKYSGSETIKIEKIQGRLSEKLILQNIELSSLQGFPLGAVLKIQKLNLFFKALNINSLSAEIFNGRLILPESETIIFSGICENAFLDIDAYSKSVSLRDALDLFVKSDIAKNVSGKITDLDVDIKGTFLEPVLEGSFRVEKLVRNGFSMVGCPVVFSLTLKDIKYKVKIYGEIMLKNGTISGKKTAVVKLNQGRILFDGEIDKPSFDLKATSIVEQTKIDIVLQGTLEAPKLRLTSEPTMSQEKLLVVLATGKIWKGTEGALGQGKVSPDLAGDFIDYFVFGGSGARLSEQLGIRGFSVKYDKNKKGLEVKKAISDKLEASYGVEQSQAKEQQLKTTQKVGADYKVTENVSVGAERELEQQDESSQKKGNTNDKVLLKYKEQF